jgi:hypothetical protein
MATLLAEAALDFQPQHDRIGPVPDEIILRYVIASERIRGPRIAFSAGAVCGSEWGTVRGDGMIAFESRQVVHTKRGDPVSVTLSGLYDCGDDGYLEALDDVLVSKVRATFVVRFNTAAKEYRWLNRALFAGGGVRDFGSHTLRFRIFDLAKP